MKPALGLVAAAAGTEMLAQGYLSNVSAWVTAKTNGNKPVYQYPAKGFGVRAVGFGVVAVVLSFADEGEYSTLATAFGGLLLATVLFTHGPLAFANLGGLFGVNTAGALSGGGITSGQSSAPAAAASGTAVGAAAAKGFSAAGGTLI